VVDLEAETDSDEKQGPVTGAIDEGDEDEVLLQAGIQLNNHGQLDIDEAVKLATADEDDQGPLEDVEDDASALGTAVAARLSNLRRSARVAKRQDKVTKLAR